MVKDRVEQLTRIFFLILFLAFYPDSGATQVQTYLHEDLLDVERITVEQGLSHNTVIFIFQDSLGFMWFGTGYGINRYDGYYFKNYRHDEMEFTASTWFAAMAEDQSGNF